MRHKSRLYVEDCLFYSPWCGCSRYRRYGCGGMYYLGRRGVALTGALFVARYAAAYPASSCRLHAQTAVGERSSEREPPLTTTSVESIEKTMRIVSWLKDQPRQASSLTRSNVAAERTPQQGAPRWQAILKLDAINRFEVQICSPAIYRHLKLLSEMQRGTKGDIFI